ncbi:hypothetical protein ElyMa_000593600 [Elysia marginata]|uniref:Uncharacterized protein n=1 Tax=Elysia marginata TaxID=1093978 RepID=A0AAV4G7R0_9GAST|nr:hypothetical protein ElyMa_000593600 [Elysia marginata]
MGLFFFLVTRAARVYSGCVIKKCSIAKKYPFMIKGAVEDSLHRLGFTCKKQGAEENAQENSDGEGVREYGKLSGNPNYQISFDEPEGDSEEGTDLSSSEEVADNGQMSSKVGGASAALLLVALVAITSLFTGL